MDLTDGLAKDLHSLLPPQGSAALDLKKIPLSDDAQKLSKSSGRQPTDHAFCDGEDYELLFTIDPGATRQVFETQWHERFPELKLSCIGEIQKISPAGPLTDARTNTPLPWTHGFEHLSVT